MASVSCGNGVAVATGCSCDLIMSGCNTCLHLARGSKDLRDGCDCHKVQLQDVLPVCNEGRDANLEGWVDAGRGVGGPATHEILGQGIPPDKS